MSLGSVYVRARDGALYRQPLWVFPEGFVCFDESEPAELVLWLPQEIDEVKRPADAELLEEARVILSRVFGFGSTVEACSADVASLALHGESQRVIPGGGLELAPARSYFFEMAGKRPPRPSIAEGTERYPSRVAGTVFDWPATAVDAKALEIPE